MKFGFQPSGYQVPDLPRRLAELAQRLEKEGFDSFWVMDHLFQIEGLGPPDEAMLEAYTTLGYLAGVTRRLSLGAMVSSVTFRHPGLLIKMATTLDALSGGRAWLGLGTGWFEREHRGLGIPFPAMSERFERLEEVLQILQDLEQPFLGKHYQLAEPIFRPWGRLPILVGGMGKRGRCVWWPVMRRVATSFKGRGRPRSRISWKCCVVTAASWGVIFRPSRRPRWGFMCPGGVESLSRSCELCRPWASIRPCWACRTPGTRPLRRSSSQYSDPSGIPTQGLRPDWDGPLF